MAPKKGGKKDDKKGGDASAEMTEKELLEQAKLRIESLEQQLVWREEKTQVALAAQKELQERLAHYHADFEREKEEIFDISADMTRQYKGMQEELIAQVNKLQQTIAEQKDELERSQLQLEEVRRQMAVELALKDAEIKEQKDKMEDMAVEFGEVRACRTARRVAGRVGVASSRAHWPPRIDPRWSMCAFLAPLRCYLSFAIRRGVCLVCALCADAQGDARQDEREDRDYQPGLGGWRRQRHIEALARAQARSWRPVSERRDSSSSTETKNNAKQGLRGMAQFREFGRRRCATTV